MTDEVADGGGEQRSGHSLIGYVVEKAEGMDEWVDGGLVWREPGEANPHVEVVVRDAGDGRFVPGARVEVTPIDPDGNAVGIHEHPLLGHPMLYHDGRTWAVPMDGDDTLRVRVAPPTFMRHDEINGRRFLAPAEVEFRPVKVTRGQG